MTKIEWTDESWNPIVGCSKISAGCQNCYAERMARRLKGMGLPQYQDIVDEHGWTGKIGYASERVWEKPLRWRKPRRVFVCSMGDLFHSGVNRDKQVTIWFTMERCPQHTFQVLTKRPEAMRRFVTEVWSGYTVNNLILPNVWLGVTVEQREHSYRTAILADTPAIVRFVSFEPLLGPVDNYPGALDRMGMDWAMKLEWALGIVEQCQAAGVSVFVKQIEVNGKVSHDPGEWPPELRVRQYPRIRHNQQED